MVVTVLKSNKGVFMRTLINNYSLSSKKCGTEVVFMSLLVEFMLGMFVIKNSSDHRSCISVDLYMVWGLNLCASQHASPQSLSSA